MIDFALRLIERHGTSRRHERRIARSCAALALALALEGLAGCGPPASPAAAPAAQASPSAVRAPHAARSSGAAGATLDRHGMSVHGDIGFRDRALLEEHFRKHGAEFGNVSRAQYLRIAQDLRDRPTGGDVLELVRADGVTSRFDRQSGTFIAFNSNGTIRTCFRPRDGERYFRRQAIAHRRDR